MGGRWSLTLLWAQRKDVKVVSLMTHEALLSFDACAQYNIHVDQTIRSDTGVRGGSLYRNYLEGLVCKLRSSFFTPQRQQSIHVLKNTLECLVLNKYPFSMVFFCWAYGNEVGEWTPWDWFGICKSSIHFWHLWCLLITQFYFVLGLIRVTAYSRRFIFCVRSCIF